MKRVAIVALAVTIAVMASAGLAFRDRLRETRYRYVLEHGDADGRTLAAEKLEVLGANGSLRAVRILVSAMAEDCSSSDAPMNANLRGDSERAIRQAIVRVGRSAVPFLLERLKSWQGEIQPVHAAAGSVLFNICCQEGLHPRDPFSRVPPVHGDRIAPALSVLVRASWADSQAQKAAAELLDRMEAHWLRDLENTNTEQSHAAARLLAGIPSSEAVPILLRRLRASIRPDLMVHHSYDHVCYEVLLALGARAVPGLVEAVRDDDRPFATLTAHALRRTYEGDDYRPSGTPNRNPRKRGETTLFYTQETWSYSFGPGAGAGGGRRTFGPTWEQASDEARNVLLQILADDDAPRELRESAAESMEHLEAASAGSTPNPNLMADPSNGDDQR